ncbi:hypothetical protein ACEQ8H_006745 [Pleosporales sp. CAS-2024a]
MPYTPPSQRSPASSKTNSPILSRTHSYIDQSPLSPVCSRRPSLPRSVSSTSYLNKLPRSNSSWNATADNTAANGSLVNGSSRPASARGSSANGSLRQSPSPVNDLLIPSGAISTPPDSSDDEERGRSMGNLRELQQALQHIDVKREPSPVRDGAGEASEDKPQPPRTLARTLSAEARKIAHSRSSSDIALSQHYAPPIHTDAIISSSDGSDAEDDELRIKPPLLRKKSGELVKPALRPPSRRRPSSMPGTPTYSKAVHFNEDIEQVRHFLHSERPIAVSAGSSPVETYDSESEYPFEDTRSKTPEWEIKLANFPVTETYERQAAPVRVERIFLATDNQTLVGNIACANISFQKLVVARFTLDYWKTTSEVVAEFNHDVRRKHKDDGYDRFNFNIKLADLANLESKTLLLCVRYQVNGQEFWDNNNSMNYQVDFSKKTKHSKRSSGGGLGAIPRSRHSPLAPRPRSMPPCVDDDFGNGFENKFSFGSPRAVIIPESPSASIKLKPRSKRGSLFPGQASSERSHANQAFSARYDFSASLSAALSTAQTALGDRSGIKVNAPDKPSRGYFDRPAPAAVKPHSIGAPIPGTRPDSLTSEKPDLQSAEYNELIQKFCFFGSPSGKVSPFSSPSSQNKQSETKQEQMWSNSTGSNTSSASNSPASPAMPVLVDGANDVDSSRSPSPFLSRSASPGPVMGSGLDDLIASQYQYGYNMPAGMFSERSHTPQACV